MEKQEMEMKRKLEIKMEIGNRNKKHANHGCNVFFIITKHSTRVKAKHMTHKASHITMASYPGPRYNSPISNTLHPQLLANAEMLVFLQNQLLTKYGIPKIECC